MRLLICTQKVDRNDSVLGFFHRWIEEFAKHYDSVVVLCLSKGEVSLPENVHVYSLGKEKGRGRLSIAYQFLRNISVRRSEYDAVFVHMNPEYLALGGLPWRFWKKPIALWYNHKKGSMLLRLTAWIPNTIFHTSPSAYTARYAKAVRAPVGVDTAFFTRRDNEKPDPNSILFLGRISPVKRVVLFLDALKELDRRGIPFKATLAGDILPADRKYGDEILEQAAPLINKGLLAMQNGVPHEKTRELYARHAIYVNLTPSGSLDKTILEAASMGSISVVTNDAFQNGAYGCQYVAGASPAEVADILERALRTGFEGMPDSLIASQSITSTVKNIIGHLNHQAT